MTEPQACDDATGGTFAIPGSTRYSLLAPTRRTRLRSLVTLRRRANDRDGGRRLHRVLDTGDGRRFVPVAAGLLTGTPLRVDLRTLPGDSRARLRVIATDRVPTGSDDSGRLRRVPVKAPSVQIAAPATKSEVIAGEPISQLAFVSDLQDVPCPAARVVWESSLQGRLGIGGAITPTLAPGTHVITVRATNRERRSATATVTVVATQPPPSVDAILGP